jgi:beta-glucanase (GH16 family)
MRLSTRLVAGGAVFALLAMASACSAPGPEPVVGEGWTLAWSDEFDGESIDASKWSHETNCWGGGNNEQQCYTDRPENSFLRDGKLVIHAQEESFTGPAEPLEWEGSDPNNTATLPYTSARLRSAGKGDWTYGRFEIRAKLPGGQGVWPAIWMLPTEQFYGPWAGSGEIDILEAVNLGTEPQLPVYGTLHYGGPWPANTSSGTSFDMTQSDPRDDFHTYAIEWATGEIRWYVDDVHFATQTSDGWFSAPLDPNGNVVNLVDGQPFNRDFHLLLNLAIGGAWPGNPDDTTQLPVEMEVDFVRVWECAASPETLEACATVSPDAEHVEGSQPVDRSNIEYDPDFINQDVVTVFDDTVQGPYYIDTWASSGNVQIAEVEDPERGTVMSFTYNTDESVAFFQSVEGFDFSPFTAVEFDLFVAEDPRGGGGFMMKTDCFYPCGTGDVPIPQPTPGEWTHYSIPLADLVAHPNSTLDVTTVNTPLVIMPDIGNQEGVVLYVDNVRVVR